MNEFHEALGRVAAWTHATNDTVVGSIVEDGGATRGYQITRQGYYVDLVGTVGNEAFDATFSFRFSSAIANAIPDEQVRSEYPDRDLTPEGLEAARRELAREEVAGLTDADLERFQSRVEEELGSLTARTSLIHVGEEPERWDGFVVFEYLYPYDDGFGPQDYDDAVDRITDEGIQLTTIAFDALDVLPDEDKRTVDLEAEDDPPPGRGFQ